MLQEFIGRFTTLHGARANVQIKHMLYGNQKMKKCVLHPFADGEHIGLIIDGEERYINMDELSDIFIDNDSCYIKSNVMELYINHIEL